MFESIVIRKLPNQDRSIDAGLLAETLLFYGNVHLLLDIHSLSSLLIEVGPENLLRLIKDGFVKATYFRNTFGTHTSTNFGFPIHDFAALEISGFKGRKFKRKQDRILNVFENALGDSRKVKRQAIEFHRAVPIRRHCPGFDARSQITDLARQDLEDASYVTKAIQTTILSLVPDYQFPKGWYFRPIRTNHGFVIDTNLDLKDLNSRYPISVQSGTAVITPPYLVNHILEARADLCFSSSYQSELVTTSVTSRIMQHRIANLHAKRLRNNQEIASFQDVHLDSARAIRDTINSGERTFDDFIKVLYKSQRFRHWLQGTNPDIGLLKEYHDAAIRNTWIDSLPTKVLRFAVFSAFGFVSEISTSLGLNAADSLLLDRILKGWKPIHFIEGPLTDFTDLD